MPTSLKRAFKYPMLSKTIVSSDSGSIRNEMYRPDGLNDYYISNQKKINNNNSNPNIVQYEDNIEPHIGLSTPINNSINPANDMGELNHYALIESVLKNPQCVKILKAIFSNDSHLYNNLDTNNPYTRNTNNVSIGGFNLNFSSDDILRYLIIIGISVLIYKALKN